MRIVVEFIGDARLATNVRQTELEVSPDTTYRDLVRLVGERFPTLVGAVIEPDGETLMPANMLNLNGRRSIGASAMGERMNEGDRVTFMSILAGG